MYIGGTHACRRRSSELKLELADGESHGSNEKGGKCRKAIVGAAVGTRARDVARNKRGRADPVGSACHISS
jgi:hypothetical protein